MNPWKRGLGLEGREVNSGWNWQAMKKGWFFNSTISTNPVPGLVPETTRSLPSSSFFKDGLTS